VAFVISSWLGVFVVLAGRADGLCALSVFSVPLWFDRLLESISVNDPKVAMPRSRRRLIATDAAPVAAL
jgi:hypothetical protein